MLFGKALVRTPKTAYVFTGQGSAQKGMGMDLYHSYFTFFPCDSLLLLTQHPFIPKIHQQSDPRSHNRYGIVLIDIWSTTMDSRFWKLFVATLVS